MQNTLSISDDSKTPMHTDSRDNISTHSEINIMKADERKIAKELPVVAVPSAITEGGGDRRQILELKRRDAPLDKEKLDFHIKTLDEIRREKERKKRVAVDDNPPVDLLPSESFASDTKQKKAKTVPQSEESVNADFEQGARESVEASFLSSTEAIESEACAEEQNAVYEPPDGEGMQEELPSAKSQSPSAVNEAMSSSPTSSSHRILQEIPECPSTSVEKKFKLIQSSEISIDVILKDINNRLISDVKKNFYVRKVTEVFLKDENFHDVPVIIFKVLEHLRLTQDNPIESFRADASCTFLLQSESCVVSALVAVEEKSGNIIENFVANTVHVIMCSKDITPDGLASLCRVVTEMYKLKNDFIGPLQLCLNIFRYGHKYSSYLVANCVGVWLEPFRTSSHKTEGFSIVLSCVVLAASRKPKKLDFSYWEWSKMVIETFIKVPHVEEEAKTFRILKKRVISLCTADSHSPTLSMLMSAVVIMASLETLDWIKVHVINGFVCPHLEKYSTLEPNKAAFSIFCELLGDNYVQDCAAVAMVKCLIMRGSRIESNLAVWTEENKDVLNKGKIGEIFKRKSIYYSKGLKQIDDIVLKI